VGKVRQQTDLEQGNDVVKGKQGRWRPWRVRLLHGRRPWLVQHRLLLPFFFSFCLLLRTVGRWLRGGVSIEVPAARAASWRHGRRPSLPPFSLSFHSSLPSIAGRNCARIGEFPEVAADRGDEDGVRFIGRR
jgi:hypothetical protein